MRRVNVLSPEFDRRSEREGFRWQGARIGRALGAEQVGCSLYELGEGERSFPFHFHHGMEEWAIVIAGAPVLRDPSGERALRAGDVVCFPPGPEGAHQLRGPGTVLMLSANRSSSSRPSTPTAPSSASIRRGRSSASPMRPTTGRASDADSRSQTCSMPRVRRRRAIRSGYQAPFARLGPLLGASALGLTVYELGAGNEYLSLPLRVPV